MSTIIEIRPDHGGKDAEDFTAELADSLRKHFQKNNVPVALEPASEANKAYVLRVQCPPKNAKWLQGVHTVTRIPKGSAARHTSSATVVILDPAAAKIEQAEIRDEDIRVDRYRGRGSGGQRKNKVSTAVRLVHEPTGIVITRETGRSQAENLESAKEQLLEQLSSRARKQATQNVMSQREVLADKTRSFTHNYQRGEVIDHSRGKRWDIKVWNSGKFKSPLSRGACC